MDQTIRQYGLIGYPITYSFSPSYFKEKFEKDGIKDARYDLYPLEEIEQYEGLKGKSGLNVTIPYKEVVIPFIDELDETAEGIGAVNTIKFFPDGRTKGFNTDIYGFEHSLKPLWKGKVKPKKALILGTGGASKAVKYVLDHLGIEYKTVSRTQGDFTYDRLTEKIINDHRLIVNTTPLGTSPRLDECPDIPYDGIGDEHILYDLIYNPEKTLFLNNGANRRATIKSGLQMLELQADKAWEIWNS